jgi:acetyl-CoA acetyltransferase
MANGPVPSSRLALERAGLTVDDIDRWEINEAFSGQLVACVKELGLEYSKVNVNGGAVGLGHPLAATGTRLILTLSHELKRCGGRYGIATACIGGGQGIAVLIESIPN